jgi:DNA-binding NtrC family response regulator
VQQTYIIPKLYFFTSSGKASPRHRIAVVDDEHELADLYAEALRIVGYTVDVFTNSMYASQTISSEHLSYSLLLTDVRMPSLSGIELARSIAKVDDRIKIVLISAFELLDDTDFQCIKKPIHMSELREVISNKLKTHEQN